METKTVTITARPAQWDPARPIGAGAITDWLTTTSGIPGVSGVSVAADGAVSVEIADPAQGVAVVAALDALDPASEAAIDPEVRADTASEVNIQAVLDAIEAKPASERTDAEKNERVLARAILRLYARLTG